MSDDAPTALPPRVRKMMLSRREEDEGGRVLRSRVLEHFDGGNGSELLVIAAAVKLRTRRGSFQTFPRFALALHADAEFARVISIRAPFVAALAAALREAPDVAAELLAACEHGSLD